MTASQPAPFRFEMDFGAAEIERISLTRPELEARDAEARAAGHAAGFAAGEASAVARAADSLAGEARRIAEAAEALLTHSDVHRQSVLADAVTLADCLARKLAHRLLEAHPTAEIAALVEEALPSLLAAPHLVIRCAPDLADDVRDVTGAALAVSTFSGRLVVLGDPEIARGDARIEWADGGLVRDRARLEAELDTRIAAFLGATPTPPEET